MSARPFLTGALEFLPGGRDGRLLAGEADPQGLQLLLHLLLPAQGRVAFGLLFLPGGGQRGPRRRELGRRGTLDGKFGGQFGPLRGKRVAHGLQFLLQV